MATPLRHPLPSSALPGVIGAGAGFTFQLGRPFPADGEAATAAAAAAACISCHLDLHLVGRRVPNAVPLNNWTAAADFGLDVLHVLGPRVADWPEVDLRAASASLGIDGHVLAAGRDSEVLWAPLAAVAWLARRFAERDLRLDAGDLVATGNCMGLVQVLPGQTVSADFGSLGRLDLSLS